MPKSKTCPTGSRKVCIKKGIKVPKEMKVQRKTRKARKTKKVIKPVVKTEKKTSLFSNIFGSNEEEKPTEVVKKPVEVLETPSVEEKSTEVLETKSDICLTPEELETIITEYKSVYRNFSPEKEAVIREKMVGFCMNDKYKKLEFYPKIGIFNSAREEREELIAQAKAVIDDYLKYSSWAL
jgi:hypothetical protein